MTSHRPRCLALLVTTFAMLAFALGTAHAAVVGFVPGRLLVKFQAGTTPAAVAAAHASAHGKSLGKLAGAEVEVVAVSSCATVSQSLSAYLQNKNVAFAEPDGIAPPDLAANDPYYLSQWYLAKIGGPAAWDVTTGSSTVTIAILDTGVDPTHPDLAAKLVPGWNAYDNNSDTHDVYGHGTSTAGVAAAVSNNGKGIASVAWGCRLMPIRISDLNGYGYYSTAAAGLTWAADHGARVANISYEFTCSATVLSAAQYFQSKGGVVTISAGNEGTALTVPSSPYALTVGATDSGDARASFSNTGNVIDLVAPGADITTTANGGGYRTSSGTSFSAPLVAGVCALVLSVNPSLTASQVQNIVKQSADDLGAPGWDSQFGAGRVNAARAVQAARGSLPDTILPTVSFLSPANGTTLSGQTSVQLSASDNCGLSSVSLSVDGGAPSVLSAAPYTISWDTAAVANGSHRLTAQATDTSGNVATAQLCVTVSNLPLPVVQIIAPANGASLFTNVWVAARASSKIGISRVDLYMDKTLVGTCASGTASYWISTLTWSKGTHLLTALAYDTAGNSAWSAPDQRGEVAPAGTAAGRPLRISTVGLPMVDINATPAVTLCVA